MYCTWLAGSCHAQESGNTSVMETYFLDDWDTIILPAISFIILADTDAVIKSTSLSGLYSTISAPTIKPKN